MNRTFPVILAAITAALATGCDHDHSHPHTPPAATAPTTQAAPPAPTGQIDIPPQVRRNLGITFAQAQYRRVADTLRVPGRFELLPTARHEIRAPFGGRVELLVSQYDPVKAGQLLARISSPEWHRLQLELEEDAAEVTKARAELAIAEQSLIEGRQKVQLLEDRAARLLSAEVRRVELESELAAARSALPRLQAEVNAKAAAFEAAKHHLPLVETAAASQLGISRAQLLEVIDTPQGTGPRWLMTALVEVRAADDGIVDSIAITDGGRVDALGPILTTIDPTQLRFRAVALQSDLASLREGQPVAVISPSDRGNSAPLSIAGTLHISPDADPNERTIDLIIRLPRLQPWCRPGVSAFVDIPRSLADEELAIPSAAIIQDGLTRVFFRRDRNNPDLAIRTEADLGITDGRWVVINSGLAEGDEVVLDGIYELKLATGQHTGQAKGGHFHADGTWHADGEPEPGSKSTGENK
jgi:multidrug efflux pump subunit AcrA (membrane-fusion protein)